MKKDYNTKKKATIIALSLMAVCLAAGLFYYVGTLGNGELPSTPPESQPTTESQIVVPEIKPEPTPPTTQSETADTTRPETSASQGGSTITGDVKEKPSANKPKSPSEVTVPTTPPAETDKVPVENPNAEGECQPEQKPKPEANQPQGGEKQDGKIYVPGFGWIEDSGEENETIIAPNAGTGEKVGDM